MGCVRVGETPALRKAWRFFAGWMDCFPPIAIVVREGCYSGGREENYEQALLDVRNQKARGNFSWLPKTNAQTETLGFFFRTHRFGRLHALDPLQARCLAL